MKMQEVIQAGFPAVEEKPRKKWTKRHSSEKALKMKKKVREVEAITNMKNIYITVWYAYAALMLQHIPT